jgi:hypothetical protein
MGMRFEPHPETVMVYFDIILAALAIADAGTSIQLLS